MRRQVGGEAAAGKLGEVFGLDAGAGPAQHQVAGREDMAPGREAASTTLRRATSRVLASAGVGCLTPSPRIASTRRMPRTMAANSCGSAEARWSGPGRALSRVRCFSIRAAPRATAASAASTPWLWSE